MTIINLNTQENVKLTLFPDNQPHVNIAMRNGSSNKHTVVCSITDSKRLLELCMVADAIENVSGIKEELIIPYLMGARFDRIMNYGDSFDLRVIARIINSLGFNRVILFDPHSDVAPALIDRSVVVDNKILVGKYTQDNSVLIVPDGGAEKKASKYPTWNPRIKDVVHCIKHRNVTDGSISLEVIHPEKCDGKDCVIIDDICDGGRTFIEIAGKIAPKSLTLIVSHGIFSRGFSELEKHFTKIITSNSYNHSYNSSTVEVVKVLELPNTLPGYIFSKK